FPSTTLFRSWVWLATIFLAPLPPFLWLGRASRYRQAPLRAYASIEQPLFEAVQKTPALRLGHLLFPTVLSRNTNLHITNLIKPNLIDWAPKRGRSRTVLDGMML